MPAKYRTHGYSILLSESLSTIRVSKKGNQIGKLLKGRRLPDRLPEERTQRIGVTAQLHFAILLLRVDTVERSGEGDGFADVVEAAEPGYYSLDAHAEA